MVLFKHKKVFGVCKFAGFLARLLPGSFACSLACLLAGSMWEGVRGRIWLVLVEDADVGGGCVGGGCGRMWVEGVEDVGGGRSVCTQGVQKVLGPPGPCPCFLLSELSVLLIKDSPAGRYRCSGPFWGKTRLPSLPGALACSFVCLLAGCGWRM